MLDKSKLPRQVLKITAYAYGRIEAYAKMVAFRAGRPVESGGYLLGPPALASTPNPPVTNAVLAHEQTVSTGSVEIDPRGVLASNREIERMGMEVLGWWHAHPSTTFHSSTDDANMKTVSEGIANQSRVSIEAPEEARVSNDGEGNILVKGERFTLSMKAAELAAFLDDKKEVAPIAHIEHHSLTMKTVYSLVVSATGAKPYAEVAGNIRCESCGREENFKSETTLEIVPSETREHDFEQMEEDIDSRVTIEKGWPKIGKYLRRGRIRAFRSSGKYSGVEPGSPEERRG